MSPTPGRLYACLWHARTNQSGYYFALGWHWILRRKHRFRRFTMQHVTEMKVSLRRVNSPAAASETRWDLPPPGDERTGYSSGNEARHLSLLPAQVFTGDDE